MTCVSIQLACDGLWEVFSSQGAVDFVRRSLKRGDAVSDAADLLAREALRRGVGRHVVRCSVAGHDDSLTRHVL